MSQKLVIQITEFGSDSMGCCSVSAVCFVLHFIDENKYSCDLSSELWFKKHQKVERRLWMDEKNQQTFVLIKMAKWSRFKIGLKSISKTSTLD